MGIKIWLAYALGLVALYAIVHVALRRDDPRAESVLKMSQTPTVGSERAVPRVVGEGRATPCDEVHEPKLVARDAEVRLKSEVVGAKRTGQTLRGWRSSGAQ